MTVSSSFVQCTTVNHISFHCSHHTLGLFSTFLVWLKYCHDENQTNNFIKNSHTNHSLKVTCFMLHTFSFFCDFLYSSIQPFLKKDWVWKVLENFLMSFQFVPVFFKCMSNGVFISSSFFLFSLLTLKKDIVALPQSKAIWQWFFFSWNFSRAKIFWSRFSLKKWVNRSDCRPEPDFSLFLFHSITVQILWEH